MIINKCLVCGSSNLRADRALSGRIICTSCGNPYGVRNSRSSKLKNLNPFSLNKRYLIFLSILIFAFILVVT
tara:strand:+ start:65 stop:280 length:216 start_codon:yes stop_codon:yes gene_type:complete